ncbi:hypothetical protein [Providencia sp. PROV117]|uniref:hypothetical protein n=1 Tax=Providencia sp. PROV117 TaxID=2949828 RepID=UPI00234A5BB8|nr:hypothetical protein [Providencia sp. PROV117]
MKIQDKLALSGRNGTLALIDEGLFLRCYDKSLFLLVQFFYPELKVCGKSFKNLQGQWVLYGGFPKTKLAGLFSGVALHQTEWGIDVPCDEANETEYPIWRQQQLTNIDEGLNAQKAEAVLNVTEKTMTLNEAEYRFLAQWEPGRFPASVDAGFIQGLKQSRFN